MKRPQKKVSLGICRQRKSKNRTMMMKLNHLKMMITMMRRKPSYLPIAAWGDVFQFWSDNIAVSHPWSIVYRVLTEEACHNNAVSLAGISVNPVEWRSTDASKKNCLSSIETAGLSEAIQYSCTIWLTFAPVTAYQSKTSCFLIELFWFKHIVTYSCRPKHGRR